ncbi:MAG TPA: TPM domain-containing protein [Pirellulales bacterium]|jgi:uncharacterized protein
MAGNTSCRSLTWLACLIVVCCAAPVAAEVTIQDPGTRVVDKADVIEPATRQKLEDYLAELERKTTAQIKVLTIPNADGEDIVTFTQRHFDLWKLGQKGKDNGALIILDVGDHKIQIEPGYGLEGALPDSYCGSLSRKIRDEFFKAGQYSEGLHQLTVAVANKVADDQGVKLDGVPDIRHQEEGPDLSAVVVLIFFAIVFMLIIYSSMRRQHQRRVWRGDLTDAWYWGRVLGDVGLSVLSSGGSGGSSGGGFGGGGGSFGGGGSSGGGGGGASW